ncbi:alpha/beta hydrolase [Erysipelothrix urinaevulpis]|uniref:alpha/beta hydrolase n=1 Tax=Erysipelothrix urinaevulpis TaxID=2683717 RepID=UPI00135B3DA6|nr:phospholipase [Erysipelothrix urinaevulpis]
MNYIFKDNKSDKTLVLFHGTGGDEKVLLPIANQVAPSMNHLSLQGEIVSFGKRRFSKVSHPDQLVDEDDLLSRVPGILKTVEDLKEKYQLGKLWALGFSNGSMTLTGMILTEETPFDKVILLRPLDFKQEFEAKNLSGLDILIHSGKHDPVTPSISAVHLEQKLLRLGARVNHKIYPLDHRMNMSEIKDIKEWFDKELDNK